tara:strand:- start:13956 stop:14855 length:900 start_codon:yes stop_codon:yes gene_type:complete
MGKVLVKSPAAAAPLSAALGNTVQEAFKVKTPFGRGVGGALGGLTALTSLADASENQQDFLSGAQMAAGRGVGAYIGAGKVADSGQPAYDKAKTAVGQTAARLDPRASQQVGVQASRGQVQRFKEKDFDIPEGFQLGMLGTSMGGGNYVAPGQQGIQRNLFNPATSTPPPASRTGQYGRTGPQSPLEEAGMGSIDPTMMSGDARAYGRSGVPTMTMEQMGQMLPGVEQPPLQTQNAKVGSTEVGVPAKQAVDPNQVNPEDLVAEMNPQGAAGYFGYQNNMKNAGEPMELAFMLLKSVMR